MLRRIVAGFDHYNQWDFSRCSQRIFSVELIEFSYPLEYNILDPLEYAGEVVLYVNDQKGNYMEHIVEV